MNNEQQTQQADNSAQATVIPGPEYGADEVPQTSECVQCGTQIEGPRIMWKYCNGCVKENEQ